MAGDNKEKTISEKTRKKMSLAHKGENHHFFGKKLSPEHIEKVRIGRKKAKGLLNETEEERRKRYNNYKKKYALNNPDKVRKSKEKSRKKAYSINPKKRLARNLAEQKIKIPKNQLCQECNERLAKHRHHEDYSRPLQVNLLCKSCHNEIHRS